MSQVKLCLAVQKDDLVAGWKQHPKETCPCITRAQPVDVQYKRSRLLGLTCAEKLEPWPFFLYHLHQEGYVFTPACVCLHKNYQVDFNETLEYEE